MEERNDIVIYQSEDGLVKMEAMVDPAGETIWATQKAIAALFGVTTAAINQHLKNIFAEGELKEEATIKKNLIVRKEGSRNVSRNVLMYNLDALLSVGYRISSKRATQFRIWANGVLKQYTLRGYAVNQNAVASQKYEDLKRAMGLLENVFSKNLLLTSDQATDLFSVIRDYTYALDTLDAYDYQSLQIESTTAPERFHATYDNAMEAIKSLKNKFGGSDLFGVEKDASFHSSIGQIYQTWDGKDLYPSIEEKAAMLLYLVVKNHSFVDGNKRIAATLFLWFMQNNGILYRPDGAKRISDASLVALTLMIAESHTEEMDTMVKVVVSLINRKNQ
ncbi:MAG: virulence protein RhuM/Fic/DOC family protein [Bacteroidales bacterium]|nr:virulence protein RhuM/Fic/DOC family protein [Bacteroidales bacterium]